MKWQLNIYLSVWGVNSWDLFTIKFVLTSQIFIVLFLTRWVNKPLIHNSWRERKKHVSNAREGALKDSFHSAVLFVRRLFKPPEQSSAILDVLFGYFVVPIEQYSKYGTPEGTVPGSIPFQTWKEKVKFTQMSYWPWCTNVEVQKESVWKSVSRCPHWWR